MDSILITNSQAPGAIGDAMAAAPALAEVARKQESLKIYWTAPTVMNLFNIPGAFQTLYPVGQVCMTPPEVDIALDIQSVYAGFHQFGISMPEAWARALGTTLPDGWQWPEITEASGEPLIERESTKRVVLLSPHSYSDFGTGYKHWPMGRWLQLIDQLRDSGFEICFLGSTSDPTTLPCDFELKGCFLVDVAQAMRQAACTITIDNGMGWLAQAAGAPHVHLLSVNQTLQWSWDPGPRARNLSDVKSTSAAQAYAAVMELVGQG